MRTLRSNRLSKSTDRGPRFLDHSYLRKGAASRRDEGRANLKKRVRRAALTAFARRFAVHPELRQEAADVNSRDHDNPNRLLYAELMPCL
jgi:hypothetical protein